jgi:hypothetical protein
VERLSERYPDLEFRLGATTDDYRIDVWVVKNGKSTLVDLWFHLVQHDLVVYCVRDGKALDVPDFEDTSYECDYGDGCLPHQIDPQELAEWCAENYRQYLGCDCPGNENGQLLQAILAIAKSRAERFEQPVIDWWEPGEQVLQLGKETAVCYDEWWERIGRHHLVGEGYVPKEQTANAAREAALDLHHVTEPEVRKEDDCES